MDYNKFSSSHRYFLASVIIEIEPTKYTDAVSHPKWQDTIKKEIDALEQNDTWTLTLLPPRK